jgi:hypothetical protein
MNTARLVRRAALLGVIAFLAFSLISALAWRLFPNPAGADQFAQTNIWFLHILAEKVAGILIGCVVAFVAARSYRPSWRVGVLSGVLAAVIFQTISIVVYLLRFGASAYSRYNALLTTMLWTIMLGALFAFFAVWKDYRGATNET